ncbi:MAG: T9SS type A sorting domain-containing protein [Bacteroidales bacterium]|nr:MAG: T9SS type A sorting domain-containing protein [Bacteroidales bacterium]
MNFTKSLTPAKILLCGAFVLVGLISHFSFIVAQGPFIEKASMPTARLSMGTAVVDGKIYVIGGTKTETSPLNVVEVYDPVTDIWDTKTPMPTARGVFGCTVVDGKIYTIGGGVVGSSTLSIVEVYDPVTDSWDTKTPMPTARVSVAACTVNGKIYVIGGSLNNSSILEGISKVEEYDPETNSWTTKTDKPTPGWGLSACVLEGKIYVTGGNIQWPNISAALEVYDPVTDEWETRTPMSIKKYSHSTTLVNGRIYTFGGWHSSGGGPIYKTTEEYNAITDVWTKKTDLPFAIAEFGAAVLNNNIYLIGGTSTLHPFTSVNNVYEYDPLNDLLSLIEKIEVDKSYAKPGTDSVCITTKMSDPTGITIMAHIEAHDQSPVDSLQLFDDGNHNDEIAGDGLYANFWPVVSSEVQYYYVDLQLTRIDMDTVINQLNNVARFTTIGPVTVEGYLFASSDTVFDPGDRINIKLTLKNKDLAATVPNIEVKLTSIDTLVIASAWSRSLGDIASGESLTSDYYSVSISDEWTGSSQLPILVEISSDDYVYWKDTLIIPVITNVRTIDDPGAHPLKIYPNPTYDILNIEINHTGNQKLEIEIYTVTGAVSYHREYGNINSHFTEQINLSGYAKGIYLVKVRQADSVYIGKVVVK